eukprot:146845-Chlamydomonas_euryale.AAC.3
MEAHVVELGCQLPSQQQLYLRRPPERQALLVGREAHSAAPGSCASGVSAWHVPHACMGVRHVAWSEEGFPAVGIVTTVAPRSLPRRFLTLTCRCRRHHRVGGPARRCLCVGGDPGADERLLLRIGRRQSDRPSRVPIRTIRCELVRHGNPPSARQDVWIARSCIGTCQPAPSAALPPQFTAPPPPAATSSRRACGGRVCDRRRGSATALCALSRPCRGSAGRRRCAAAVAARLAGEHDAFADVAVAAAPLAAPPHVQRRHEHRAMRGATAAAARSASRGRRSTRRRLRWQRQRRSPACAGRLAAAEAAGAASVAASDRIAEACCGEAQRRGRRRQRGAGAAAGAVRP